MRRWILFSTHLSELDENILCFLQFSACRLANCCRRVYDGSTIVEKMMSLHGTFERLAANHGDGQKSVLQTIHVRRTLASVHVQL